MEITGSQGRIELEFFSDAPLRLQAGGQVEEVAIANPPHVQQPFIQSIVDDLNGVAPSPGSVTAAMNTSRVADQILASYRQAHGY